MSSSSSLSSSIRRQPIYLTKSLFQTGLECSRKLYYNIILHDQRQQQQQRPPSSSSSSSSLPLLHPPIPPNTFIQHLMNDGYRFNQYIQTILHNNDTTTNNSILIDTQNKTKALQQTKQLLVNNINTTSTTTSATSAPATTTTTTIYEGAVQWKNCFIRMDVLQIISPSSSTTTAETETTTTTPITTIKLMEIKSKAWDSCKYPTSTSTSTSSSSSSSQHHPMLTKTGNQIKSEYLTIFYDVAFQYYVLQQSLSQDSSNTTTTSNENLPQQQQPKYNIQCSFLLPDKAKINTSIHGLHSMFPITEPVTDIDRNIQRSKYYDNNSNSSNSSSGSPNDDVLYTEIDVTDLIPMILHQPIIYPGCSTSSSTTTTITSQPPTFIDTIHEWNDIIEQYNNCNSNGIMNDLNEIHSQQNDVHHFISQLLNDNKSTNQSNTTTTNEKVQKQHQLLVPVAPIGIQCKNCEFRKHLPNNDNNNVVVDDGETTEPTRKMKCGFDYCWGPIITANNTIQQTTDDVNHVPLVIDLYYGGTVVNDMLEKKKFLLRDITRTDLQLDDIDDNDNDDENNEESKKGKKTKKKKKKKKIEKGIPRAERQWYHVQSSQINNDTIKKVILDKDYLHKELQECRYPYHMIDFETIAPVLPYTIHKRPYEAIAFQFSHHILHENGSYEHATEFLHTIPNVCPNISFLNALSDTFNNKYPTGTIFRWGPHENTILRSIYATTSQNERPSVESMERFFGTGFVLDDNDEHSSSSGSSSSSVHDSGNGSMIIQDGMIDLMSILLKGYYVHGSNGSVSIKSLLLPTLKYSHQLRTIYESPNYNSNNFINMQWWCEDVPGSGNPIDPYKLLSNYTSATSSGNSNNLVAHGGDAIAAYSMLQKMKLEGDDNNNNIRKDVEQSLLRYCELDTLAMVMIIQAIHGFLHGEMK